MKIKVQYYTLECLCSLYDGVTEYDNVCITEFSFSKEYRAIKDIINKLFIKFKKKLLDKESTCKPFNLNFEYHQAYFLVNFISANIEFLQGILEKNLLLQLTSKLHQEL